MLLVGEQIHPREQDGGEDGEDAAAYAKECGTDSDGDEIEDHVRPVDAGDVLNDDLPQVQNDRKHKFNRAFAASQGS